MRKPPKFKVGEKVFSASYPDAKEVMITDICTEKQRKYTQGFEKGMYFTSDGPTKYCINVKSGDFNYITDIVPESDLSKGILGGLITW